MNNETKPTILVVDDSPEVLTLIGPLLSEAYAVKVATSGAQALQVAQVSPAPDLVLLDVVMPGMNGYETCQQLREAGSGRTPIIFLSALSSIEERLRGYAAGGDDYVCKPFEASELLAKIERQMAIVASQRELGVQLDEAMNAVLSSADMVGEVGVVLEFQRQLNGCASLADLAQALFASLASYGLDGCLRLNGRSTSTSFNTKGRATALENSILDHLQAQTTGQRIRPLGAHTSFNFGCAILFVRDLPMTRTPEMDPAVAERHGRAIDNVALLLEGAVTRVAALDSEIAVRDLQSIREAVAMASDALIDIAARNHAQTQEVKTLFDKLIEDVEYSFVQLGLTHTQEEFLSGVIRGNRDSVLLSLGKSQEVEAFLGTVIEKLRRCA